jgi:hypothetical protein
LSRKSAYSEAANHLWDVSFDRTRDFDADRGTGRGVGIYKVVNNSGQADERPLSHPTVPALPLLWNSQNNYRIEASLFLFGTQAQNFTRRRMGRGMDA